jgi:hypothetical protein
MQQHEANQHNTHPMHYMRNVLCQL